MAHSKQAKRRIRIHERRRLENKATASSMRTAVKKLMAMIEAGDKAEAEKALSATLSRIDKAAKHNVIHDNTAARKKSKMMRAVAAMK